MTERERRIVAAQRQAWLADGTHRPIRPIHPTRLGRDDTTPGLLRRLALVGPALTVRPRPHERKPDADAHPPARVAGPLA